MANSPCKLYIIGNGFDLWHGIPSKYFDFKSFVESTDQEIHREIEEYIPVDDWWSDLESALADIDVDHLVENNEVFLTPYGSDEWRDSANHDFQYEIQQTVKRLSVGLTERFADWIRSINVNNASKNRLKKINAAATFLTFNYTDTLSALYSVPSQNVLHVHGRANNQNDRLILGHAWNPTTRKSLNEIPDVEDLDTRIYEANEILDQYFSSTFKPSAEIIAQNRDFFESLDQIRDVIVLGHSLSDVDAGYFHALLANPSCSSAKWRVACLPGEEESKLESLMKLGVHRTNITLSSWEDF